MKILIFGLPGSVKTTLAKPFADLIGAVHINADAVRTQYEGPDMTKWNFSLEGRMQQSQRMRHLADGVVMAGKIAVADFVCPQKKHVHSLRQTILFGWILSKKEDLKILIKCLKHLHTLTTM